MLNVLSIFLRPLFLLFYNQRQKKCLFEAVVYTRKISELALSKPWVSAVDYWPDTILHTLPSKSVETKNIIEKTRLHYQVNVRVIPHGQTGPKLGLDID